VDINEADQGVAQKRSEACARRSLSFCGSLADFRWTAQIELALRVDVPVAPVAERQIAAFGTWWRSAARQSGCRDAAGEASRRAPRVLSFSPRATLLKALSARSKPTCERDQLLRLEDADHVLGYLLARVGGSRGGGAAHQIASMRSCAERFAGECVGAEQELDAGAGLRRTNSRSFCTLTKARSTRRAPHRTPPGRWLPGAAGSCHSATSGLP